MTAHHLQRETFVTSRLHEYFSRNELAMQIGHRPESWPSALAKELIDNALDACEAAGTAPEIHLAVLPDALQVTDNGPGLPAEIITRSLDYSVRVSTNSRYVAPTRGQLGNALKTVWAVPYVVDGEHGQVEVEARGVRHLVDVRLDRLSQEPRIEQHELPLFERRNGTLLRLRWPDLANHWC